MTAEEYFNKRAKECGFENWIEIIVHQEWKYLELFPIEFAQYHVKQALEAAGNCYRTSPVHVEAILNAYDLESIV